MTANIMKRVHMDFYKELKDIKVKRKDKLSEIKITKMMTKEPLFKMLKDKLIFKNNRDLGRRGSIFDIFTIMIVVFVGILLLGVALFIVNEMNDAFRSIPSPNNSTNFTQISDSTLGKLNEASAVWYWSSGLIVMGLFLGFLISNFLVKVHPIFLVPYLLIVIIAIICSVVFSNVYESTLLGNATVGDTFDRFTIVNFIFSYLPIWIAFFGIMGIVLLTINIVKDDSGGALE